MDNQCSIWHCIANRQVDYRASRNSNEWSGDLCALPDFGKGLHIDTRPIVSIGMPFSDTGFELERENAVSEYSCGLTVVVDECALRSKAA